jgi:GNAT superfamily N-acetyltransferase
MADLEYEFSLRPDADPDLGPYVIHFTGRALLWDDARGRDRTVAEMRGYRLDLAAAEYDGVNQAMLLDSVCYEISEFAETVFQDQGCHFLHKVSGARDEKRECGGLVYINEITVDPGFRGSGIGTRLLSRLGQMIDVENCIIALKAFPLSDEYGREVPRKEIDLVKRFYERLGFVHAGGDFMVKEANLCETVKKRLAWRMDRSGQAIDKAH